LNLNIGITGSNGFIGKHLINTLNKASNDFHVKPFDHSYDICEQKAMEIFLKNLNVIVHLAGANRDTKQEIFRVNVIGTLNLLECISKCYPWIKVIVASSFHIYKPISEPTMIEESHALEPQTIYGLSKKIAEELCWYYNRIFNLNIKILRLSNVFGIGCRPRYNSVISTFIDAAIRGEKIRIKGNGSSTRDFIAVSDVVDAIVNLIRKPDTMKELEIFNICSGKLITLNQIVEVIMTKINNIKIERYAKEGKKEGFLLGSNKKAIQSGILKFPLKEFQEEIVNIINYEKKLREFENFKTIALQK